MSIRDRLRETIRPHFDSACALVFDEVSAFCESPIEAALGAAILLGMRMTSERIDLITQDNEQSATSDIVLIPQYKWRNYRVDFALKYDGRLVFIECDGHDYHERTKEQAARDRSRDREMILAGITVLRFTGTEIYNDPAACSIQALTAAIVREAAA